jgi:signal transduction histidine kinase
MTSSASTTASGQERRYGRDVTARTAWQAISERPLGFLASSWPWRSVAYLVSGVLLGAATLATLFVMAIGGVATLVLVVGLLPFLGIALSGIVVGRFERWRTRLVDRDPLPNPHRPPGRRRLWTWLRTRLREQATWREFGYTVVSLGALWWIDLMMLGLALGIPVSLIVTPAYGSTEPWEAVAFVIAGLVLLPFAAYPITVWAGARAALTRAILAPRDAELGEQVVELSRSRARLVDAFEGERRRIERDLHDGAQQRLVALAMSLGLAQLELPPGSPAARHLADAYDQAERAHAELRELIRGVHPQTLTDRGLPASIAELADRSPVPVSVDVALPRRLPEPVEVTAHFIASEALANIAKHSQARRAKVFGRLIVDRLVLEVRDDGTGGADPAAGTGLVGLADRVAVAGGRLLLSSPPGGPTLIRAEIPCMPPVPSG